MTAQQHTQDTVEQSLKKVQDENELLLVQIHQLEEELEYYFKRNQELERGQLTKTGSRVMGAGWVDDELPDALAENQRLHTLVERLRKTHQLENQNALNIKLGNILIQGVESPGNLMTVPAKIIKIWRESSRKKPPKAIGGKGFNKLIAAYDDGGFEAVEKLLADVSLAPAMQANGYTALARKVMTSDRAVAAEAARRAYEADPQLYRLKWLVFRLYEAGDVIEAEAMLDVLPTDTTFSESEARLATQLRNEAKHVRQHEAKQKTRFLERRAEVERQIKEFGEENELLSLQLRQAQEELESQYLKCQMLEQDKVVLAKIKDEQEKLVAEHQAQIEQLNQTKMEREEENELFLFQLQQVQEELESQYRKCQTLEEAKGKLEKEKSELIDKNDEQAKLEVERQSQVEQLTQEKATVESTLGSEIETLKYMLVKLEEELVGLTGQKDEQAKLAEERQSLIEQLTQEKNKVESELGNENETLKHTLAKLEAEVAEVTGQKDEQAKLAEECQWLIEQLTQEKNKIESELGNEMETLKHTLASLEEEMALVTGQKDEQAKLAEEREWLIEQLTQEKTTVEKEKTLLRDQKDEQSKLVEQLNYQLREARQSASVSLKLQMLREADLKELQARYQASREKEENQHQLLIKLGERLSTASAYFNKISNRETREFFQEGGQALQAERETVQNSEESEGKS